MRREEEVAVPLREELRRYLETVSKLISRGFLDLGWKGILFLDTGGLGK
jgi:hypothetical protein